MNKEEFGVELKRIRKEKGLSAKEAADGIGIHANDIWQIEKGNLSISNAKKKKILSFYGYDYQNLIKIVKKD